jgi:hypothetical protein
VSSDLVRKEIILAFSETGKFLWKVAPLSLVLALLYTTYVVDLSVGHFLHVNITATGERTSPEAKAAVVWLRSPSFKELRSGRFMARKSKGWIEDHQFVVSLRDYPSELAIFGYFTRNRPLQLFETGYSGEAHIEIDGITRRVDLFRNSSSTFDLQAMNNFHPAGPWMPALLNYLFVLLRSFIVIVPCMMLLHPIYVLSFPASIARAASSPSEMPERSRWKGTVLLFLFLLILGTFLVAFYPGVMTVDSYEAYYEGLTHRYIDWHPPIMAALWSITDKIVKGAGGLFLLNSLAAVVSFFLLAKTALRENKTLFFLPMLGLFLPFVTGILFALWSDVSLAVSFLLSFSLWYFWRTTGTLTRPKLLVVLIPLFYASSVRHNALPAAVPFIFLIFLDFSPKWKALAVTILTCFLFYTGNQVLSYSMLRTEKSYTIQAILSHDLMSIYSITGKNYFPEGYLTKSRLDALMPAFDQSNLDPTTWMNDPYVSRDASKISQLKKRWLTAVKENPFVYLAHRWLAFRGFLTIVASTIVPASFPPPDFTAGRSRPLLQETALGKIHTKYVEWASENLFFLFQPLTYLIGSGILLFVSIRRKIVIAVAMSSSALLYMIPYFFVAPAPNFRYVYWSVFAVLLSVYVLWMEESKRPGNNLRSH